MKKHYLLIVALIISILLTTYALFTQKQQRQSANETFQYSLSEAASCFGMDYIKLDDENKIYYYMKAAANLHTAISMLPYTSYSSLNNSNKELTEALTSLYMSITIQSTPKSTNRLIAFTEKRKEIFEVLHYISKKPNDKNNCKALTQIAKDIGY